jgi:hypothetical protein
MQARIHRPCRDRSRNGDLGSTTSVPLGVTRVIVATFRLLASATRFGLPVIALVSGEAKSTCLARALRGHGQSAECDHLLRPPEQVMLV